MVKVETQGVEKKTTASFNKQLVIPSNLTNTNVLFSKIIQITYEIRVTCKTKGYRYNPKVYIPITLGSIPLFFDEDFQPMYLQEDEEIDIRESLIKFQINILTSKYLSSSTVFRTSIESN